MPADNKLWIPPLPAKDQKRINRRQKYQGLVKWTGFPEKTLWDWLHLLSVLAIPVVIAAGTLWFTAQQSEVSSHASDRQRQADIQVAQDQQREMTLKTYLDDMADLLLNHNLRKSKSGDEVSEIARERTLTVLRRLDAGRNRIVIQFLQDARLIGSGSAIINLTGADLKGDELAGVNFSGVDLIGANFDDADLEFANLNEASLSYVAFDHTDLSNANLSYADLSNTYLGSTNFGGSILAKANFKYAIFDHVNLSYAVLNGANLAYASVSNGQLSQTIFLKGAIMPDGSKHP